MMRVLFQILRATFYFLTLLMGAFLLRGDMILGDQLFLRLKMVMMPGYLLFCGVMVGYVIALIWSGKTPEATGDQIKEEVLKKSFIIGVIVGLVLALSYVFI